MSVRPTRLALPLVAAALAALPACGTERPAVSTTSSRGYIEAVQALLDPAARVAQVVADQLGRSPGPTPRRADLEAQIHAAGLRLADLRALRLADPSLRSQRDRIVGVFAPLIPQMREVVNDLARRDRNALRADAGPFFASIRLLPSSVASSSPSY